VRIARLHDAEYRLELHPHEMRLLWYLLQLYPLLPADYHRITRQTDAQPLAGAQELLEQSMASREAEQKRYLAEFLGRRDRLRRHGREFHIHVSGDDMERLLQLLNDVRVGSWVRLGCRMDPDDGVESADPREAVLREAMRLCAWMQMLVLEALHPGLGYAPVPPAN